MWNSPWFGGLFRASRADGITPLDRFSAAHYTKITSLYSVVTAILGFSPNRHEGKITGVGGIWPTLGALPPDPRSVFRQRHLQMESMLEWTDVYGDAAVPTLAVDTAAREELRRRFGDVPPAEIAATLQHLTEAHVLEILNRARQHGWTSQRLCLAGGLFANVTLNQRISDLGFDEVFVAPAMADDGTAVGAALEVASRTSRGRCARSADVFWGYDFDRNDVELALDEYSVSYSRQDAPAPFIVQELVAGNVVALFQGRMEFGPRALGHRSILCAATRLDTNAELNARLRRTEFMPFAPVTRLEDVEECYEDLDGVGHAAEFMTVTRRCTDRMRAEVPAVVHVDGTARPQIVRRDVHPLLHDVLTRYRDQTGLLALVNTSFNVHEEPIVCSPRDALRAFLEAGLDVLYLEGGYVVRAAGNGDAAAAVMRQRLAEPTTKERQLTALVDHLYRQSAARVTELTRALEWGRSLNLTAEERLQQMLEKEQMIRYSPARSID